MKDYVPSIKSAFRPQIFSHYTAVFKHILYTSSVIEMQIIYFSICRELYISYRLSQLCLA